MITGFSDFGSILIGRNSTGVKTSSQCFLCGTKFACEQDISIYNFQTHLRTEKISRSTPALPYHRCFLTEQSIAQTNVHRLELGIIIKRCLA